MRPLIYIMTPVLILTILLASRFVTWDAIRGADQQAQIYVQDGTASLRSWKLPQAIKAFTRAIEIEPRYAEAYVKRGLAYYRSAQYKTAIADYTQTLKLNRYQADAYASRGDAYQSLGDMERAIEDYSASLKRRRSPQVIQKRAETYFKKGDVQKTLADYDDLIKWKPTALAYYGRGNVYLQLSTQGNENRLQLALADLDQAIALKPSFTSAYISRAQVHSQLGDRTLASQDTRHANKLLIDALDKKIIQALMIEVLIKFINAL
ncbi:hypothetical protein C6503_11945 [Candidatus Poribacteria bacterium]|nr:MAG: hypothetical protein C6503_11945 [Candidatus Poribacteria bacterium]